MKEKVKKIIQDKNLWLFTVITLLFFGILARMEFATDTYATLTFSLKEFAGQFISSGRFLLVVVGGILKVLSIKSETIYCISFLLAIICMIVSMYKLYNIIEEDISNKYIKKIIPILIVLNPFSIELFLYIEKGIMLLGVLMCIFAVGETKKWFEHKSSKYLISTFIFMLLANFCYQGVVGIYVTISLIYIIKYSKNIKQFIQNNIVVALSYGIPALIDYIIIKILSESSRVNGDIILIESLKKVFLSTKEMILKSFGTLPKYLFVSLICLLLIVIIYHIIRQKEETKFKILKLGGLIYIIIGTIFASVAPQFMQSTDQIWLVARSTYSFASLFGILMFYLYSNFKINNISKLITVALSSILIVVQFYRFNIIQTDRYRINAIDEQLTKNICKKIDEYEKTSGNTITKIAFYEDKGIGYRYSETLDLGAGDMNIKAYAKDWAIQFIIKYYSGRNLGIVPQNPEIEEKFKNQDWNYFDKEQLIFDGETLHFCKY